MQQEHIDAGIRYMQEMHGLPVQDHQHSGTCSHASLIQQHPLRAGMWTAWGKELRFGMSQHIKGRERGSVHACAVLCSLQSTFRQCRSSNMHAQKQGLGCCQHCQL